MQGQASDIDIQAREILRMREELNEILARHSGQSIKRIEKDTDRDNFMTAEQAKDYGLLDDVIVARSDSSNLISGDGMDDGSDPGEQRLLDRAPVWFPEALFSEGE